jgi:hypothetical protein
LKAILIFSRIEKQVMFKNQFDQFNAHIGSGRPDHDQQHCYHHAPTVKLEAAITVVELLIMGVMTPETC